MVALLYPDADPADYEVRDDGTGPYIAAWSQRLGPQPTEAQLQGRMAEYQAARVKRDREQKAERVRVPQAVLRALCVGAAARWSVPPRPIPEWAMEMLAEYADKVNRGMQ